MLKSLDRLIGVFDAGILTSTKRGILEAFIRLATLEGYGATSIRGLASSVGLKPPSLYSHFPDGKEQIIGEALKLQIHAFSSAVRDALRPCTTPHEFWSALIRLHVHQQITLPENEMWDILVAKDRLGPFLRQEIRVQLEEWQDFCDFMYQAIAEDMGYDCCVDQARVIRQALDASARWWRWDGSSENLEAASDFATKIASAIIEVR